MIHNQIHIRAEFSIDKKKVDEFKRLIQKMSKIVEANEPDTIQYQFYLNGDGTKCIVHETYTDSEATLVHNESLASKTILPKIFNVAKMDKLDVYGNPNGALQNLLRNHNTQIYNLVTGFNR